MDIVSIHVYPIKSLGGFSPSSWEMDALGLRHDRRWMLVDDQHRFITLRQFAHLIHVHARVEGSLVTINAPDAGNFSFPIDASGEYMTTEIWNQKVSAAHISHEADEYFSRVLGQSCKLVKFDTESHHLVNPAYAMPGAQTSFTDGYPVLVIGTASLDDLNRRLATPIGMDRFRPSLVVSTFVPFDEDEWQLFSVGQSTLRGVKLCSRCIVTGIDPLTGSKSDEPLRTLASYRKKEHHVCFGQNAIPEALSTTTINLKDEVKVVQRGPFRI